MFEKLLVESVVLILAFAVVTVISIKRGKEHSEEKMDGLIFLPIVLGILFSVINIIQLF